MPTHRHLPIAIALFLAAAFTVGPASAQQLPAAIDAPGMTKIVTLYAIGAQIFECKAGNDGKLAWAGREPIAALTLDGKTVGRHYAGPSWEHTDGSIVVAKAVGNAPGKSPNDAAWLKLEVTSHKGDGILSPATIIQRVNTQGGGLSGNCDKAGDLKSVAYTTDYIFLKK
jgi:Protein of unknown function (DUF3455)